MSLKKELKSLSKKELMQLVIAIDAMYQCANEELHTTQEMYMSLRNDVEEYRESLRLIGDRAYTTLEPTYESESCKCIEDQCCSKCPIIE